MKELGDRTIDLNKLFAAFDQLMEQGSPEGADLITSAVRKALWDNEVELTQQERQGIKLALHARVYDKGRSSFVDWLRMTKLNGN